MINRYRLVVVQILLLLVLSLLIWRLVDLAIFDRPFLMHQGKQRFLRVVNEPGYRGMLLDRNGEPLAVSTMMIAVWANPQVLTMTDQQAGQLANILGLKSKFLKDKCRRYRRRAFVYLQRGLEPDVAQKIKALHIPGVFTQREFKRFYPKGPAAAHAVGFTNIDDVGQEGLELALNNALRGQAGKRIVLKDRLGHVVADVEELQVPEQGQNIYLSIDDRIQFFCYQALMTMMQKTHAHSASVVVLDVQTGEVLGLVNVPSYNPNQRLSSMDHRVRNRVLTDVFEPGSTLKAFSVAAALETGRYHPDTQIDTHPGYLVLNGRTVRDVHHDLGVIDLTSILKKSSNVGIAKVALSVPKENLVSLYRAVGFGRRTQSIFPGEVSGYVQDPSQMRDIDVASLAFGYGISVTPMQLAAAYSVIANQGVRLPITLLRQSKPVTGQRVMPSAVAQQVLHMLESVVSVGGTGRRARIRGYRIAGKTGTAEIAGPKGYDDQRHIASFVGIAPASSPRFVVAVVVREPQGERYYASQIAAPVFARVMSHILRLHHVTPDALVSAHTAHTARNV